MYIIAGVLFMLPFINAFLNFIFSKTRRFIPRRRQYEYPLLERGDPGIRPVYSNDIGFKNIGTLYSQSTTDDSVLNLFEQYIDRDMYRYKAVRSDDGQSFFLAAGEKMRRLENDATVQITGLENAGTFVVQRTNTLLYWPF